MVTKNEQIIQGAFISSDDSYALPMNCQMAILKMLVELWAKLDEINNTLERIENKP